MKTVLLWVLMVLAPVVVSAQDITGTWQGTLQAGRELRTVVRISREDNALRGVLYSIDQGGQPTPTGPISFQGGTVRFQIPALGASYEGRLSADNNTITGAVTQGQSLPLVLTRATPATAWAIPTPPPPPAAMTDPDPTFEVTTVKPSNPDAPGRAITVRGRIFETRNTTLMDVVTFAYGVHPKQVTGMPSWVESEKFDLQGTPAGAGQPNDRQWRIMLQKLIAERFALAFHRDKKTVNAYALTIVKPGLLTKSEGDPNGLPALFFRGPGILPARNANMADLAGLLQNVVLDRPVVDQTGLQGRFDFQLNWTPDDSQFGGQLRGAPPQDNPNPPPGLFTAIQEQLGLKLETTSAPIDVLVVDKVERPQAN